MAQSKRKALHATPVVQDDEEQKRRDRLTLIGIFALMVLVVIAMVLISKFLSGR